MKRREQKEDRPANYSKEEMQNVVLKSSKEKLNQLKEKKY